MLLLVAISFGSRTPGSQLRRWWPSPERLALRERLAKYTDLPADVAIATQAGLGPHLAHRNRPRALRFEHFSNPPFEDGELIVLSPHADRGSVSFRGAHTAIDADPRFEVIERNPILEVYRWRESAASTP